MYPTRVMNQNGVLGAGNRQRITDFHAFLDEEEPEWRSWNLGHCCKKIDKFFCDQCFSNLVFRGGKSNFRYEKIRKYNPYWKDERNENISIINEVTCGNKPLGSIGAFTEDEYNKYIHLFDSNKLKYEEYVNHTAYKCFNVCRPENKKLSDLANLDVLADIYSLACKYNNVPNERSLKFDADAISLDIKKCNTSLHDYLDGFDGYYYNPVLFRSVMLWETGLVLGYPIWSTIGLLLEW